MTVVNAFYRDYTGGVSGFSSDESQKERLGRIVTHWDELDRLNCDTIYLHDMNLDYNKWGDINYNHHALRDQAMK